ncbi:unnamed protein product [Rhizoctonia solani]|uniref:Uncharacterized protein n=1 Tax=Rhizoctonia solani TaxID=456999 RepID=A0A8H2XU84_9AGAM|nr:unnamed protein product [Rhizoctonia solani]
MRRAARERQRKHRAVVRARRVEDESAPEPQPSAGGSSSGNAPTVPEGTLPVSAPEPAPESHIEQEVNPGEPHPTSYEQPPAFYYPPPGIWPGGPFPHGQFFHPHTHPGAFVQNGQMMPPPHMIPVLAPPQTMNPMQMQVSPTPPSPRPAGTPAPAPTPSPAPAPAPEPEPTSAPAPQPSPAPPVTPSFTSAPAPAPAPAGAPVSAPAPAPAPASTPAAPAAAVPTAASIGLPMSAIMSLAGPPMPQPPPSHTPGQSFAMIISLALNINQSQWLRAHMMQQLRLTIADMTELEGVIARAFDAWDRERGEPSNTQLQQAMQVPGAPSVFHHVPPAQPQPAPVPPQTPTSQPQAQPPTQPQQAAEPAMPQQSPSQPRVHVPPATPQSQPRPSRTATTATTRRSLGVSQQQPQPGGTLNVPRPIAGRSVSVSGPSARSVGLPSTQVAAGPSPSGEQNQRTVSQPQRHPHVPHSVSGMRSASSVTLPVAGQKRPAPGPPPSSQPGPSQTRPMHSASVSRSTTQSSPQTQTRPQPSQQHSRPGSQPQTPVLGPSNGANGNKTGNGGAAPLTMPVLGHGSSTLA